MFIHIIHVKSKPDNLLKLPKACSNSGAKMIKFSGIVIWSKIPLEIKNSVWDCFQRKKMYYSATTNIVCFLFIRVQKTGALI